MANLNEAWVVHPHGPLTEIATGVWTVEGSIKMPLGRFPRRMTVVVLESGDLAVWSAISLSPEAMARIDQLGPVRFLIVPNAGHRLDVRAWKRRYPDARVIAPTGARKVVEEAVPVDTTANVLGDETVGLDRVRGFTDDEFAMVIERADGTTLVLNDILASVRDPHGLGANIMAWLFGFGVDRPRVSRLIRWKYVEDGAELAAQFREWAAIPDLRRIVVSHVDVIEKEPKAVLARAARDFQR